MGLLQDLFSKGVVDIHQKLSEKYKPKLVRYVRLSQLILETHKLEEVFEALKNAPKQKQLLMGIFDQNPKGDEWKKSKDLLDKSNSTPAVLEDADQQRNYGRAVFSGGSPCFTISKNRDQKRALSDAQQKALNEINNTFEEKSVVLFQGVTGSGRQRFILN